MTEAEFDVLVARVTAELSSKQRDLEAKYRLGTYASFHLNLEAGLLEFKDSKERVRVRASITPVGSFSARSGTWKWAWANDSVPRTLRDRCEDLQGLSEETGMKLFLLPGFESDEAMAWELTGMAVARWGHLGGYRAPAGDLAVFVSIASIAPTLQAI